MANPNPKKRLPGGGVSLKPSVYITPELAAEIEWLTAGLTPNQRSRTLGRWLILGMETERRFEAAVGDAPAQR